MKMHERPFWIILSSYLLVAVCVLVFCNGTGGAGDSIGHYLYARYAPVHPELFFDHWAKPLFVLLASPFAQFGFTGMKVMNLFTALGTAFFTYKVAQQQKWENAWAGALLLLASPLYFSLTFSGLTEPLFAFVLIMALYGWEAGKKIPALVALSFLPFVRSEGLLILGVFGLYLLYRKQVKFVFLLLIGHVVYSLAGAYVHGDILWVFNKIPYAKMSSTYGSGTAFHFVEKLNYVLGVPFYVLFWIGMLHAVWKAWKRKLKPSYALLIIGTTLCFVVAHSVFWYYGIFNSMGLKRVMLAIIPLFALVALDGLNALLTLVRWKFPKGERSVQLVLCAALIVFPLTKNPAALNVERDLMLLPDQVLAQRVAQWVETHTAYEKLFFAHPYLSMVLEVDYFDSDQRQVLSHRNRDQWEKGDVLIWESWFCVVEQGVRKEDLLHMEQLKLLHQDEVYDGKRKIEYLVFEVIEK